MKRVKYLAMMLAAGMFAACSDTLEDTGGGNAGGNTPSTTEGYVKVAINMPTTSGTSTRSTDGAETTTDADNPEPDVTLDDGEANEYEVQNAIIAFFKATAGDEDFDKNATFVKAYSLGKNDLTSSGSSEIPQVTEQVAVVTEAPKVSDKEQLYALVILNYDADIFKVSEGVLSVSDGSSTTSLSETSKLADLQTKLSGTNVDLAAFIGSAKNQFTMTNSPLSSAAGTSATIASAKAYTLVPVTVYDNVADANNHKAATIYVERVVAKVTLTSTSPNYTAASKQIKVTNAADGGTEDIVEITGWCLNVVNNSTKLVRDVSGFTTTSTCWLDKTTDTNNAAERFAGTRAIENALFGVDGEQDYYRIYWAQDANYYDTGDVDPTAVATDFTTYYGKAGDATFVSESDWNKNLVTTTADNACYCLENTMNYDQQLDDRTTGIIIRTNYWTKFAGEDAASKKSFFICGTSSTKYPENAVGTGDGSTPSFVDQIIASANTLITTDENKIVTTEGSKGLKLKENLTSGTYTNIGDVFVFTESDEDKLKAQKEAVSAAVGGKISYYKDGANFYRTSLIRHFLDDEGVGLASEGVSSGNGYGLQHLGRYGVVRNNWYEIDINSVSGPGDPEVPQPGGDPDDSSEGYMRCTINVLSWAKRSQSVDL